MRKERLFQTVGHPTIHIFGEDLKAGLEPRKESNGATQKSAQHGQIDAQRVLPEPQLATPSLSVAEKTERKTGKPTFKEEPKAVMAPAEVEPTAERLAPVTQDNKKPVFKEAPVPTLAPAPVADGPAVTVETAEKFLEDQVNDFLDRVNTYVSEHNTRFADRNGDLTDAYVGDSQEYLNLANQKTVEFTAASKVVRAFLDKYGNLIDSDWAADVVKMLDNGMEQVNQVLEFAKQDNEYWVQFSGEEDYKTQQTAVREYNEMLNKDLRQLELGVTWVESKLEKVSSLIDKYLLINGRPYYEGKQDQMDALMRQIIEHSAGWASVSHDAIISGQVEEKMKAAVESAQKNYEEIKYLQTYHAYMDNIAADDYAQNSQYVSTRTGVAMEDALWGIYRNQYDTSKLFGDFLYDYINKNQDALGAAMVNDVATNATFLGVDQSFYQTMTKEEIGVYNYLYKTQGKEKAEAFLQDIGSDLRRRDRILEQEQWAKYANEHPVGASIFSVVTAPMKSLSYIGQFADWLDDGKIDENAGYNRHVYINAAIRSEVSRKIEESGKWGEAGSFAYNTGMGLADFLFTTTISGGNQALALAIMGTGSAADTTLAAKDRGLSDNEAFALGAIAGAVEVAMEKVSFGAWLDGDMSDGMLRYMMKNAIAGGSEEVGTNLINTVADIIIAGDKSQWNMTIQKYIDQGKTPKEAFGLAVADKAKELGLDFLGGSFSNAAISAGTNIAVNGSNTGPRLHQTTSSGTLGMTGWDGRVAVTEATGQNVTVDGKTYALIGKDANGSPVYQDVEVLKEQTAEEPESADQKESPLKETEMEENPEWFAAAIGSAEAASADSRDNLTSVAKGHIMDLQSGFMCFPEGDPLIENTKNVTPKEGFFDVAMHGSPTAVAFGGREANMSPRLLAEVIRHNPNYHGENIRLLCCSTGLQVDGAYCFAEELANALGVTVEAPNMEVYTDVNGNITVGRFDEGQMIEYRPNERGRIK